MNTSVASELGAFHRFVGEKLGSSETELSPEDVLREWRLLHPVPEELSASVAAVRGALADMAAGDAGRPATEIIAEIRNRHQLPSQ